jgi:hypothetical protein
MNNPESGNSTDSRRSNSRKATYVWFGGVIGSLFFTWLIWYLGPDLNHFIQTFIPFQGGFWYFWKLPTRNFWTMVIVWSFYLANQFLI